MEFRNPVYNRHGTIDCEVNHPRLGWIAFTASPDDPEESGRDIYAAAARGNVGEYVAPEEVVVVPDRITARQFKLQLEIDGLTSSVEGWVAQQTRLVQIAYANSGTFVRTEPMMEAGFTALGFSEAEGDAFFTAAAAL